MYVLIKFKKPFYYLSSFLVYEFSKEDALLDVGAHIGPYTLIASRCVGLNGKVVAIEADPANFDILNRNIQLNILTNVIALNYAAYSKED